MKAGARRWVLRYGPRPHGAQQARNLRNARKRDGASQSAIVMLLLLQSVKLSANKGWVRPVPAAAVIPAPQVVANIIGPKASVAGLESSS